MELLAQGALRKMSVALEDPVSYTLVLGDTHIAMNALLGQPLTLRYGGRINCCNCGRATKKSFNQGYCYPCMRKLARCDSCIVSPEKCHYFDGSCREPDWADAHCMRSHIVYLANSTGVKVGITRETQLPTRWIDQGAVQAMPVMRVSTRQQSGFAEVILKRHVSDRTQWQRMLKGGIEALDLAQIWRDLRSVCAGEIDQLQQRFGVQAIQLLDGQPVAALNYPVLEYPHKVRAHNLDRHPEVTGTLLGIKGQYLILDTGVINIRKFTAYWVEFLAAVEHA